AIRLVPVVSKGSQDRLRAHKSHTMTVTLALELLWLREVIWTAETRPSEVSRQNHSTVPDRTSISLKELAINERRHSSKEGWRSGSDRIATPGRATKANVPLSKKAISISC